MSRAHTSYAAPIFKPISKSITSSEFHINCKFRISNRFHRPIFISISKKGGLIKITRINVKLTFTEYAFLRVKNTTGSSAAIYTTPDWVGQTVSVIPMKLDVTDRYIETCWNEETQQYELEAETDVIFKKNINAGKNIGRAYLPKDLIGMDVLVIKTPTIQNLY